MIRIYRWNSQHNSGTWLEAGELEQNTDEFRTTTDMLWIDLEAPTPEEEKLVFERFFHIHSLSLEDVRHLRRKPGVPPHFPKAEEFPDYLFVIVNPLVSRLLEILGTLSREDSESYF